MDKKMLNYIPDNSCDTGNYWCTWDTQYRTGWPAKGEGTVKMRNVLTQDFLFSPEGMLRMIPEKCRQDLYVLLDDGWDVRKDIAGQGETSEFGSLILNEEKFPDMTGEPWERLAKLKKEVIRLGYRGLGLWICANGEGEKETEYFSKEQAEKYWKEKAIWCRKAEVDYWKVDWGYHCKDAKYRDLMTRIVKEFAPDLKIEHASCRGAFDYETPVWKEVPRLLPCSDYFRTYDVIKEFTYSTTISRIWETLGWERESRYGCRAILNVEDGVLLAAGLGCSMGVMRHPSWGGTNMDILETGLKWNEVERALMWQRIAPPFGIWESSFVVSEEMLEDRTDHLAKPDADGWLKNMIPKGGYISQKAPAILARNMDLPKVTAKEEDLPFVVCCKHPQTGAVGISFLPRTCSGHSLFTPMADAFIKLGTFVKPIGIFGEFNTVTIELEEEILGCIYLQDLCRQEAAEVTELVEADSRKLVIDYHKLCQNRLLENDPGDKSAPGFMLYNEPREKWT